MACFFDFHDTRELPKKIQKPLTDLPESRQATQSESKNAFNWMPEVVGKKKCLDLGHFSHNVEHDKQL